MSYFPSTGCIARINSRVYYQNNRNQRGVFIIFVFWHNYHQQFRQGTCCGNCLLPGSHFPFVHSHWAGTILQPWAPGTAGECHAADTPHTPSQSLWRHFWPFQPCSVSVSPVKLRAVLCWVRFLHWNSGMFRAFQKNGACNRLITLQNN